jgi:hypothetical protein
LVDEKTKFFVEIGSGDGTQNNTRYLAEAGWSGLWADLKPAVVKFLRVKHYQGLVTVDKINPILDLHYVPEDFGVLSIDVDGNDYWLWKAVTRSPKIVVIEYNGFIPPPESKVMPYEPEYRWPDTRYFGASLCALHKLAVEKGYVLVGCNRGGINAFFVRKDYADRVTVLTPEQAFRHMHAHCDYPDDPRQMISI